MALPDAGLSKDDILAALTDMRSQDVRWQEGRTFGMVYDAGPEAHEVVEAVAAMFLHDNALNTKAFPSLARIQSEVVGIAADLLHGEEAAGFMTADGAELLRAVVSARASFLVSGGTGTGKTTLLATLLSLVPPEERVVLVEDAGELHPDHPHVVGLESRPPNIEGAGAIDLRTLLRQALRMRPDRLVVGECRGAEVADVLTALNTGHQGAWGTLHANAAAEVPARLTAMASLAGWRPEAAHAEAAVLRRLLVGLEVGDDRGLVLGGHHAVTEDRHLLRTGEHGLVHVLLADALQRRGVAAPGERTARAVEVVARGAVGEEELAAPGDRGALLVLGRAQGAHPLARVRPTAGLGAQRVEDPRDRPVELGGHRPRVVAQRLGAVDDHELGLLAEGLPEAQAEVHRDADDERHVGALQPVRARPREEQLVVGGHAAAREAVEEDRDAELLGEMLGEAAVEVGGGGRAELERVR